MSHNSSVPDILEFMFPVGVVVSLYLFLVKSVLALDSLFFSLMLEIPSFRSELKYEVLYSQAFRKEKKAWCLICAGNGSWVHEALHVNSMISFFSVHGVIFLACSKSWQD